MIKVGVEAETSYGSVMSAVMMGQYLWGALKAHRGMEKFLRNQF